MRRKEYIILHHVGAGTVKASQNYRRKQYDFLVLPDGRVLSLKNVDTKGTHCIASGMNSKALSISFADNLSLHPPSSAQLEGAAKKAKELMKQFNIPVQNVLGHDEVKFARTQCPGNFFDMNAFRKSLMNTDAKIYDGSIPCTVFNFCKLYPVLKARYTGQSVRNNMFTIQIFNAPEKEKLWIDEKVRELVNAKVYWGVK